MINDVRRGRCGSGLRTSVRPAVDSDVPAIEAFAADVVPAHYAPILGAHAANDQLRWWSNERLTNAVAEARVQLAVSAGTLLGVCETGALDREQVIWKLYLSPGARGRGLGVALLEHAIAALPAGTEYVMLEHFAGNTRAAAFYQREGFEVVRIEPAASGDPSAAVVWRCRDLGPVVD